MDEKQIFHSILVATEIFSFALLGITVILAFITKQIKKKFCVAAISVLSAINLFMIPVVIHLLCIYRMQFLNKPIEIIEAIVPPYIIPGLIICILNPFVLKLSTGIIAKVREQSEFQDDNKDVPTDIKKEGDV